MGLIIGSHVSYKSGDQLVGSTLEALSYGANTFMFYTGAPQNTIRRDIEKLLCKHVYLELFVKVEEDWIDNESSLKKYGYKKED